MITQKAYIKGAPKGAPFLKINLADSFLLRLHMCFMRFAIDVVYLDKDYKILKIVKNLRPWIGLSICTKAWATLELNAGEADRCDFEIGETLVID